MLNLSERSPSLPAQTISEHIHRRFLGHHSARLFALPLACLFLPVNDRLLEQFLALAEQLHFGRAADSANISVSALSRNIRQLEASVGTPLFERDNRSVALTPSGRRFRAYARDAIGQWAAIRHELSESDDTLSGEISLYCSVTASYGLLSQLLNRFRPDFPGIEIKLHTGDPEHAITRVVAGKEDIAIAARPDRLPRGTLFQPLVVSPLVFVAPRDGSDHAHLETATPDALAWTTTPMILSEGGIARRRVDVWFRSLGVVPRVYAQVAGNEAIVGMVSLGLGIGVVPQIVLDNSPIATRLRVLDVRPELEPYDVGLVTLRRHLKNPLVEAFWLQGG